MDMRLTVMGSHSPEEQELEKKRIELTGFEQQLGQGELELKTLQAELQAFEQQYLRIVGVKYARLDEIEAQIAVLRSKQVPEDRTREGEATRARAKAQESFRATREALESRIDMHFTPSDELKKLYREVAKKIHPDLATDAMDQTRREKIMAEANSAYESCDLSRLQAILQEQEASPEAVQGDSVAHELVRVIRKIAQVQNRLRTIALDLEHLKNSTLYSLVTEAFQAKSESRDLLEEMACKLEQEIIEAQARLNRLVKE